MTGTKREIIWAIIRKQTWSSPKIVIFGVYEKRIVNYL